MRRSRQHGGAAETGVNLPYRRKGQELRGPQNG